MERTCAKLVSLNVFFSLNFPQQLSIIGFPSRFSPLSKSFSLYLLALSVKFSQSHQPVSTLIWQMIGNKTRNSFSCPLIKRKKRFGHFSWFPFLPRIRNVRKLSPQMIIQHFTTNHRQIPDAVQSNFIKNSHPDKEEMLRLGTINFYSDFWWCSRVYQ